MCNSLLPHGNKYAYFESMQQTCFGDGLGPMVCAFYHYARFHVTYEGKREKRSDNIYDALSVTMSILFIPVGFLYLIAMTPAWSFFATQHFYKGLATPLISWSPLVYALFYVIMSASLGIYACTWFIGYQSWAVFWGVCKFYNTPLTRKVEHENLETGRVELNKV